MVGGTLPMKPWARWSQSELNEHLAVTSPGKLTLQDGPTRRDWRGRFSYGERMGHSEVFLRQNATISLVTITCFNEADPSMVNKI